MALFVAVIASNLVQIAYHSARTIPVSIIILDLIGLSRFGCVDSVGQDGAFLILLVMLLLSAAVLLFLPSLS